MSTDVMIGIMQPYFLPYIGYFQLIGAVNRFVIYDNIKYTKKGWINRNRYLLNGVPHTFTLPLASGSDHADIRDRRISEVFDRRKFIEGIHGAYRGAPNVETVLDLIATIISFEDRNLFSFLHNSLLRTCAYLQLNTPIIVSSTIPIDHELRSQEKVIAICRSQNARVYVNSIGGLALYARERFSTDCIDLRFLKSGDLRYPQFGGAFVPSLSILDVLMFNPIEITREWIRSRYSLVGSGAEA